MSNVIDLDTRRVTPYVIRAVEQFLNDPPDTDYQRGFLAALLVLWREGLNGSEADARIIAAEKLTQTEQHGAERRMSFAHEWYIEGVRTPPGEYVLMRIGPVTSDEPIF